MSIWARSTSQSRQRLGLQDERIVRLDLWEDGVSDQLPKITVSGEGLTIEGTDAEFHRLIKKLSRDMHTRTKPLG